MTHLVSQLPCENGRAGFVPRDYSVDIIYVICLDLCIGIKEIVICPSVDSIVNVYIHSTIVIPVTLPLLAISRQCIETGGLT